MATPATPVHASPATDPVPQGELFGPATLEPFRQEKRSQSSQ